MQRIASSSPGGLNDRRAANLRVLKRYDKMAEEIIDTYSYVAAYSFIDESQSWIKRGIEGPLFLFKRSASPHYAILIMNRLDPENLMMLLNPVMEVVLLEEFVVYRLPDGTVQGLWMFDSGDRIRLEESLQTYCERALMKPPPPTNPPPSSNGIVFSNGARNQSQPSAKDLLLMLQKAASSTSTLDENTKSSIAISATVQQQARSNRSRKRQASLKSSIGDLSSIWRWIETISPPVAVSGGLDRQEFASSLQLLAQNSDFLDALYISYTKPLS
ncbi:hypothetical protein SeMB42_g03421 [Synchytrium endobioticum]|uniref:mRNA-decapping enzyme C-terminal domain-containing protein n=1 Tax=Synchytrium endobioticum TaxID=286115 RepID=A0A507D0H9_9FUNG|nr:hypothetical protein SeLEV6574_g04157 [Synchytrium endobioticum]TPX47165.1 hypothetical protein SeMB42_g03421 [Synchytrium endobioticum]